MNKKWFVIIILVGAAVFLLSGIFTSTQTQCEIGKIYDNTAVNPVSCSCPAGYQFETVEIGWGPCPRAGMSDCPATKSKCIAKISLPINTNESIPISIPGADKN